MSAPPPLPFVKPPTARAAQSDLAGRALFASQAGMSFGGHRDTYRAFGYPRVAPTYRNYWDLYSRGDIAARIVEAYPQALWVVAPKLTDDDDPTTVTKFEAAYMKLYADLDVWSAIMRAHVLASVGRYSVLMLQAEGEVSTELDGAAIKALLPISEGDAAVGESETDINSPRFGLPKVYNVSVSGWSGRVHWSRMVHVAARTLNSRLYGEPMLARVYNRLLDYEKVIGGGSEAAFRHMDRGMVFNKQPNAEFGGQSKEAFEEDVNAFYHNMQRYLLTTGVDVTSIGSDVPNFGSNVDTILKVVAGATGIPMRILLGSEQAKLAATEDSKNWNRRVLEQATFFGEPLVRQLNDRFVEVGMLPVADYDFEWPPMSAPSPEERAKTAERWAKANVAQFTASGQIILTSDEIREDVAGKPALNASEQPVTTPRDAAASNPEWDAVTAAATSHEGTYAAAVVDAWLASVVALDTADVMAAIDVRLLADLPPIALATLDDSGAAVLNVANDRGSFFRAATSRHAEFDLTFDDTNPRAIEWTQTRTAELVTEIGPDTAATIQTIITRGQSQGLSPAQQAAELRQIVGLRTDQLAAVDALEERLLGAVPGSTVAAGDRLIAVPTPITQTFVERELATYAGELRTQRALMIARTETMRAANQGQLELWRQAQDAGELPQGLKRIWLANTERHAEMEGRPTGINEPFITPAGDPLEPGQAPNCGCSQGLIG